MDEKIQVLMEVVNGEPVTVRAYRNKEEAVRKVLILLTNRAKAVAELNKTKQTGKWLGELCKLHTEASKALNEVGRWTDIHGTTFICQETPLVGRVADEYLNELKEEEAANIG